MLPHILISCIKIATMFGGEPVQKDQRPTFGQLPSSAGFVEGSGFGGQPGRAEFLFSAGSVPVHPASSAGNNTPMVVTITYGREEGIQDGSYLCVNGQLMSQNPTSHAIQFHKLMEIYLSGSWFSWKLVSTTTVANQYRSETTYIFRRKVPKFT